MTLSARKITLLALLTVLLAACQGLGEPQIVATISPRSSGTSDDQTIATAMMLGGEVWAANCARCHGELGAGTDEGAPLPDLTGRTDEELLVSVSNGLAGGRMPAFGETLSEAQLQAVTTYAKMISLARSRDMIGADNSGQNPDASAGVGAAEESALNSNLEMTTDPTVIQISRVTSQIEALDGVLYILQIVQFTNTSEAVYFVPGESGHRSVSVRVPDGAQMQDIPGSGYQLSSDGTQIFDVQPVLPGAPHLMHLAYTLRYDETVAIGTSINQAFDYALTGPVEVVVATEGLALNSETLIPLDTRTANGVTVTRYSSELSLPSGANVHYIISGVPVPPLAATTATSVETGNSGNSRSPVAYVLIGAGVSALVIASGLYLRERFFASGKRGETSSVEDLTEKIAALDIQHREGKLKEDDYLRQRTALKAQLSALMKSQRSRP